MLDIIHTRAAVSAAQGSLTLTAADHIASLHQSAAVDVVNKTDSTSAATGSMQNRFIGVDGGRLQLLQSIQWIEEVALDLRR